MGLNRWIAENIIYRYFGCYYTRFHDPLFSFIQKNIPDDFLGRNIADLGCGDGSNTLRIISVFKPKSVIGYDSSIHGVLKAKGRGIDTRYLNFDRGLPEGEMATFTFSLHHAEDKEKTLEEAKNNFSYLFICEPCLDLYHRFFDAGGPLKRKEWVALFDKVLGEYQIYHHKNNIIIFYRKKTSGIDS
ncbi:MAG: class I SAM-dependent methyltransferase [bacterium]